MKYGLKEEELKQLTQKLTNYPEIEEAILYGSRAKGTYKPFSDIDLCLKGDKITTQLVSRIYLALDELLLPYQIDLSVLHTLKNKELVEHIKRVGIVVYKGIE